MQGQKFEITMVVYTSQPQTETSVENRVYTLLNDEAPFISDIEVQKVEKKQ